MIEFTTGIALLVSSLYGGTNQAAAVSISSTVQSHTEVNTSSDEARFMDSKVLEAYIKQQNTDIPILVEIARCESTFRQFDQTGNILRGKVNKGDVGVMQINERYHADDATKLGYNIYTAEGNIAFGRYLYSKYGTDPWSSSAPCWDKSSQLAVK